MNEKNWFLGADISAIHGAVVLLDDTGRLVHWLGYTFKAKDGDLPGFTRLKPPAKGTDKHQGEFIKLDQVAGFMDAQVFPMIREMARGVTEHGHRVILALEDYAYHGRAGQHSIAQVGGIFRRGVYQAGRGDILIRMMCPGDIGKLTVDNGNAKKEQVQPALAAMFPVECSRLPEDTEGDMRDALALAKIARLEREVRAGRLTLEQLEAGPRRLFIRTGGKQDENLVSRPYVK